MLVMPASVSAAGDAASRADSDLREGTLGAEMTNGMTDDLI